MYILSWSVRIYAIVIFWITLLTLNYGWMQGCSLDSSIGREFYKKLLLGAQMTRTDVIGSGRRRVLLFFSFGVH